MWYFIDSLACSRDWMVYIHQTSPNVSWIFMLFLLCGSKFTPVYYLYLLIASYSSTIVLGPFGRQYSLIDSNINSYHLYRTFDKGLHIWLMKWVCFFHALLAMFCLLSKLDKWKQNRGAKKTECVTESWAEDKVSSQSIHTISKTNHHLLCAKHINL